MSRPAELDGDTDIRAIVLLLRELTRGTRGTLPILDVILEEEDGPSIGSVATLAA